MERFESPQALRYFLRERLWRAGVELSVEDEDELVEFLWRGYVTASNGGSEHWDLAWRGAFEHVLETLLERETLVLEEAERGPGRLGVAAGVTGRIREHICPMWPFCPDG